ncbi:MAG: hypothetical protein MJ139_02780, partial [Limosilactobacillus sp.]|nr:hypothetical protein [Limosilactobacillus sp.]
MQILTLNQLSALAGLAVIGFGAFHWLAKADAKDVIKDEYSKLIDAISQLTQTVMKLDIRLDQSIKNQVEQNESIKRQDKRLD